MSAAISGTGIVIILFTDIEGSALLWERDPERMRLALARHDEVLRDAVKANRGTVVKMMGDGMHAAFDDPSDAVGAVLQLQQALASSDSTAGIPLRVRCGLHAGVVERRDSDFFGNAVNRAARIMREAHGGQCLLSQPVADLVRDRLPPLTWLRDLGKVRLRNLAMPEEVYQLVHPSLRPDFPALRALEETPNNLPQYRTQFIGRENDIAECLRLLDQNRLLTLAGIGGVGKTRLALKLAQQSLSRYPDGVWFVDLAPVQDAQRVTFATANALGVREEPGRPLIDRLVQHVAMQRTLIMLDNCEHLINAAADLTDTLLDGCAYLKVVATSREGLSISGEQTFGVRSLAVPASTDIAALQSSDAIRLFMDRAHIVNPALVLDAATGPAIADICRQLDGIPLAIELAAARMKVLKVEEIRARLNDRFRLLTGGNRALPRQQTLLAAMQWSYDHLTPPEQRLLRLLSVFSGGWTLTAASAVTGEDANEFDVLDTLTQLVAKSLISVDREAAADSRYTMLETVRQYAFDRLEESGEGDRARAQHLRFFLALAESAADELYSQNQGSWLLRLDAEHENMLAAHAWCNRGPGQVQAGLQLVAALAPYWRTRGLLELGERTTAEALALNTTNRSTHARCRALEGSVRFSFLMGRYAETLLRAQERLSIARALDDGPQISEALQALVGVCNALGELVQARVYLKEGLATAQELGGRWLRGMRLAMAELLRREGDPAAAELIYAENLPLAREQGDQFTFASTLINLAIVSVQQGMSDRARLPLLEALTVPEIEMKPFALMTLDIGASLAALTHEWTHAALFHGAATMLMRQIHHQHEPVDSAVIQPRIAEAREALGEIAFAAAQADGQALSSRQALAQMRIWLIGQNHNLGAEQSN